MSDPKENEFQVGDRVDKATGYRFPGTVVAAFTTSTGEPTF